MKNEPFTPPSNPGLDAVWLQDRDELVFLPAALYLWGALKGDTSLIGWALAIWVLGFGIWCIWTVWRVTDRFPKEDTWRAVATLVWGGAPWFLSPFVAAIPPERLGLTLTFPAVFVPAVWAIFLARRRGVEPLPRKRRARLLAGASALSILWIAVLIGGGMLLWNGDPVDRTFYRTLAVGLGGLAALDLFLAVQLGRSAIRGFTPHRPITAESILADDASAAAPAP